MRIDVSLAGDAPSGDGNRSTAGPADVTEVGTVAAVPQLALAGEPLEPRRAARLASQDVCGRAPLLIVGSVSADELTPPSGSAVQTLGGAGLYAALGAAAVCGPSVTLVGVVGHDIAKDAVGCLRRCSVRPMVDVVAGSGLRFAIRYDTDWRAHYLVDGADAEAVINYAMVAAAGPFPAAVHLCPTGPAEVQVQLAAALRAEHGAELSISATTFCARILSDRPAMLALWGLADLMICDVVELQLLTQCRDVDQALERATELTGPRATCATDGARGAYVIADATITQIPAYPSATLDPTGAGESFAGALAAARLAGHGLIAAAAIATAVASLTVEAFGVARLAQADAGEITRRATALAGAVDGVGGHRG